MAVLRAQLTPWFVSACRLPIAFCPAPDARLTPVDAMFDVMPITPCSGFPRAKVIVMRTNVAKMRNFMTGSCVLRREVVPLSREEDLQRRSYSFCTLFARDLNLESIPTNSLT